MGQKRILKKFFLGVGKSLKIRPLSISPFMAELAKNLNFSHKKCALAKNGIWRNDS